MFRNVVQRFLHHSKQTQRDVRGKSTGNTGAFAIDLHLILLRELSTLSLYRRFKAKQLQLR
jgi:hypothetical protein